jgi:hypothetical protein
MRAAPRARRRLPLSSWPAFGGPRAFGRSQTPACLGSCKRLQTHSGCRDPSTSRDAPLHYRPAQQLTKLLCLCSNPSGPAAQCKRAVRHQHAGAGGRGRGGARARGGARKRAREGGGEVGRAFVAGGQSEAGYRFRNQTTVRHASPKPQSVSPRSKKLESVPSIPPAVPSCGAGAAWRRPRGGACPYGRPPRARGAKAGCAGGARAAEEKQRAGGVGLPHWGPHAWSREGLGGGGEGRRVGVRA